MLAFSVLGGGQAVADEDALAPGGEVIDVTFASAEVSVDVLDSERAMAEVDIEIDLDDVAIGVSSAEGEQSHNTQTMTFNSGGGNIDKDTGAIVGSLSNNTLSVGMFNTGDDNIMGANISFNLIIQQ